MKELKTSIDLKALADEEIQSKSIPLNNLWMVKDHLNKIFGPFDTASLRDFSIENQHLFENSFLYNLESEKWSEFFAVSQFQRRRPKLVSKDSITKTNQFFLMTEGQKDGPYSTDEIKSFLTDGKIITTDQLSINGGKTWIKVYEHHEFDRRAQRSNQELPFVPNQEILEKINITKNSIEKIKETEDAIVGLAMIGSESKESKIDTDFDFSDSQHKSHQTSKVKIYASLASMCMTFIIIGILQYHGDDISSFNQALNEVKSSRKSIDNSERQVRKPASVENFVNKKLKYKPIKKIKRIKPKRFVRRTPPKRIIETHKKDIFPEEVESLDINDPEVQEELTRQLAGEYNELDGEPEPYDEIDEDEAFPEDEAELEPYDDRREERVDHSEDDY